MGNPSKISLRKDTYKLRFRMNIVIDSCRTRNRVVGESLRVTKLESS